MPPHPLLGSYAVTTFAELETIDRPTIIDARRHDEFSAGHLDGAVHVPLHELIQRLDELPHDVLYVHCQSGYRASIAASLLDRSGRDVVLVDDDFANAESSGHPIV